MAKLLYHLNGAEEDEAEEVRALLTEAQLDFYETNAGRFRISLAAIWLKDEREYPRARSLLDEYQLERQARIRAESEHLPSTWQSIKSRPIHTLMTLVALLFVLSLVLLPFYL